MNKICDINESGEVLATYTKLDNGKLVTEKTKTPLPKAVLYAFLPAGFPNTVTDDYLTYQTFDSLQAFSSSITNLLANRAILEGLGVGKTDQTPTTALFLQIIQDTFSRLATILFAHRMGQAIEPECKYYRFLADVFNDCAQFLDLLLPVLPLVPKVSVMVSASVLRALCGVAAGASKATLSAHFATNGNLAELNAKEASQETVVSLLGMLAGTLLVRLVEDKRAVWAWMIVLVTVHLVTNYCGVRAVKMRTLNRQRATIVFREYLETGLVLTPAEVATRESILLRSRGNMASKTGAYTGTCDFGGYGALKNNRVWGSDLYEFEADDYYLSVWSSSDRRFTMRLAVKEGARTVNDPLMAWFDAVAYAYRFETAVLRYYGEEDEAPRIMGGDGTRGGGVDRGVKLGVLAALKQKGWEIENHTLETRTPVRVRVGDAKIYKGM